MRIIRSNQVPLVPASHEDPNRPGVWKRVLAQRNDLLDGRVQMVNWAVLPAGHSFEPHYHQDMQELFIIVDGEVHMAARDLPIATKLPKPPDGRPGEGPESPANNVADGATEDTLGDAQRVAEARLAAGDMAIVEPGEIHQMSNRGTTDAQYLVVGISLGKGGRTVRCSLSGSGREGDQRA